MRGYTLVELVVVIGVMVVIIGAGMGVFYQSLRSGSRVDFELFIDTSSRVIENSITDLVGFSRVVSVAGQDQDVCLAAGSGGVAGDSLTVDVAGSLSEYLIEDDYIASNSSRVSPEGVTISNLSFTWVCLYGEKEKMEVSFVAQAEKEGQVVSVERSYSFDILLKNSGYY